VAVAALVATILVACGTGGSGGAGEADAGCPAERPVRVAVSDAGRVDAPSLHGLLVCASLAGVRSVLVTNTGEAAWNVAAPGHLSSREDRGRAAWFGARVDLPEGLLLPGTSILVQARPDEVAIRPDPSWTVAWASLRAGLHVLGDRGRDGRRAALAPQAPRGRALVSCALSARLVYAGSPATPSLLVSGVGAIGMTWSSDGSCAADWRRADRALAVKGARPVTWATALPRAQSWLRGVRSSLGWLDRDVTILDTSW
jgi:hypothetical protein